MNKKTFYLLIITIFLLILILISVELQKAKRSGIVYDNNSMFKYNYGKLISIPEKYDSTKQYFDYDEKNFSIYEEEDFDDNGIVLHKLNDEYYYTPASISYYGLMLYSRYIENQNIEDYEIAKKQADYLVENQNKDNGGFYYNFEKRALGTLENIENPWISAAGQAQAISLLSRIYYTSKEEKYKEACELAIKPFFIEVKDGGVKVDFFGNDFYEEFPTSKPNYSLNGHLHSLISLYDLYSITGNTDAKVLYDNGIKTVEKILQYYDYKGISLYNLAFIEDYKCEKYYSETYHIRNISKLEVLNQIEENEVLSYFIKKWSNYVKYYEE